MLGFIQKMFIELFSSGTTRSFGDSLDFNSEGSLK